MFAYAERVARWANVLRADPIWTEELEKAFDSIGFDQNYLAGLRQARRNYSRIKAIKDHIWGMIELEPGDAWLLDCPLLQRMRHVRQTGFTFLTYPNAHHTRMEHSLGVYQVVKRLLASFRRTQEAFAIEGRLHGHQQINLTPAAYPRQSRQETLVLHAALLHDVGHGVFSHVSERLFAAHSNELKIGKQSVRQFRDSFRLKYELVEGDVQTGRPKPLAELLTIAIITSKRFEEFYKLLPGRVDDDPFPDLCDIAVLVLGDRIEPNDFALPEVLSGPVDADKIDYMIRDAHACGISIGIDVARVFVRAGIYEGSPSSLEHLKLAGFNEGHPLRLFVIEQSGTDAVRELGTARLSLYERVYNHQLTRGAQAAFGDMILRAAKSTDFAIAQYADFLTLWQQPEDVVLSSLKRCGDPAINRTAQSLLARQLPKRAACFAREYLNAPEAPVDVVSNALQDAHELRLQEFADAILARLDGPRGAALLASIQQEATIIHEKLTNDRPPGISLPKDRAPPLMRFLPYPRAHDSTPPPALVIRGDRVERFGDRYFSYLYAGETSSQIGYLLVPDEWREIALLACQNVVYRNYGEDFRVIIEGDFTAEEAKLRNASIEIEAQFRPCLNAERIARRCKLRIGDVDAMSKALIRSGYFDSIPALFPHRITKEIESIAERFSEFSGEQGWKVGAPHVATFVSQFPPGLRSELISLLQTPNRFLFLGRDTTIKLVANGLATLNLPTPLHLVPLTPSSGQYIRTHIRGSVDPKNVVVHASLNAALAAVKNGGSVAFIDDNISSGTQSSRQLDIYMGGSVEKPQGNYIIDALDESEKALLRSRPIAAAFSVGHEDGRAKLAETARKHGIQLAPGHIVWGRPITDFSGKGAISDALRTFLEQVGTSVLQRRFEREGNGNAERIAQEFALGYGRLEALVATSFSVPTATYPAFWCPGFRNVPQDQGKSPFQIPWMPLFLRTNMLRHLVLG